MELHCFNEQEIHSFTVLLLIDFGWNCFVYMTQNDIIEKFHYHITHHRLQKDLNELLFVLYFGIVELITHDHHKPY